MKKEVFKKDPRKFTLPPNLKDYEKTYQDFSWKKAHKELTWFCHGTLNAAFNAIDRHTKTFRRNKVALYWENEKGERKEYSFWQLASLSNQCAHLLKKLGLQKGERIFLFLPRLPELYTSFLGILKMGGVAGTLFQAFGPSGLLDRLSISQAKAVFTTRKLSERIYKIKKQLPHLKYLIITDDRVRKRGEVDYRQEIAKMSDEYKSLKMHPQDYAFELFTSGTTGKPKGVVHTHYAILQEHMTAKWVLDIHEEDTLWCTADPGWVTGIAYGILGSWSLGASSVVYDGPFSPEKWYEILEKYKVTVWYTAPTAVRMLMKAGKKLAQNYRFSLRHLCSVGEPLNPEPIRWSLKTFGLPFHDTWWQTETGGICIANYPCLDIKLGSMGKPIPGVEAAIVDDKGRKLPPYQEGNLALRPGWPSMMRTIWRRPKKYQSYFLKGWYLSGDRAYQDKEGYFWFIGRADDVIKTAGERVGPFEVESALVETGKVVEAGVIGKPDPERGEIIKAFCILKPGITPSEALKKELALYVKSHLAGHAYPREIEFVPTLPKTKSGKIVRRVLKAQELGLSLGDTSTLEHY